VYQGRGERGLAHAGLSPVALSGEGGRTHKEHMCDASTYTVQGPRTSNLDSSLFDVLLFLPLLFVDVLDKHR
jgi:hypothetical protein